MQSMINLRVSHRYTRLPDLDLNTFARSVISGMTGNPAFVNPLVPLAELSALQMDFQTKVVAARDGGKRLTAAKNAARAALMDGLHREGIWVQSVARHDLAMLLSSGYQAASLNRAQRPLAAPAILAILNKMSTQLLVRVKPVPNARNYQVRMSVTPGVWTDLGVFGNAWRIALENLTPGTVYTVQVRAVGGSTRYSEWSQPMSRMAM